MASQEAMDLRDGLLAWRESMVVGEAMPTIEELRTGSDVMGTFATERADVTVTDVDVAGMHALLHTPSGQTRGVVLWVHGGGLTMGSAWTHSRMSAHLAAASGAEFLNIDFRLAPENPFPAAYDDTLTAYRWLVDQGHAPGSIVIGGDSAGGAPALAALIALRDAGEQLAGGIIISGWLDFTMSQPGFTERTERDLINLPRVMAMLRDGVLAGHDPADPAASPLWADLAGLPPLYILTTQEEVLYEDNAVLAEKAEAAGVDVVFEGPDVVPHVPTMWAGNLPEADAYVSAIGSWVREHVDVPNRV